MGETGSGKSLLVARVVELLTGGKASSSFVAAQQSSAFVEMEIALREPFLSAAYNVLLLHTLHGNEEVVKEVLTAEKGERKTPVFQFQQRQRYSRCSESRPDLGDSNGIRVAQSSNLNDPSEMFSRDAFPVAMRAGNGY